MKSYNKWSFVTDIFHLAQYFQGSSCWNIYQYFIFMAESLSHCMDIPCFMYPFIVGGDLGYFSFLDIMNTAENIHVHVFLWVYVFISQLLL